MLRAIFYARFHPERGPSIIHQYPHRSIISPTSSHPPLLNWSSISSYIIPPYDLCDQPSSICTEGVRVLNFPVSIEDAKYERNRFTFNVCFVISEDEDPRPWDGVVRKTAAFFRAMEVEDGILSAEECLDGLKWADDANYPTNHIGDICPLLESLVEDLNAYAACCVHVTDIHVLNLSLQDPELALQPPRVNSWDVPLLIRELPDDREWTWDLTLRRIHPHIDGTLHVQRIAELADAELKLVKRAVSELVHHDRAILLDLFHFQAIYACTASFAQFVDDDETQQECQHYVSTNTTTTTTTSSSSNTASPDADPTPLPSKQTLLELYAALQPGLSLSSFCLAHQTLLSGIDVRRFVTFGILKAFLRRIHKFALAVDPPLVPPPDPILGPLPVVPATAAGAATKSSLPERSKSHVSDAGPKASRSSARAGIRMAIAVDGDDDDDDDDDDGKGDEEVDADAAKEFDRAWKKAALSSGWATPPSGPPPASLGRSAKSAEQVRSEEDARLRRGLDGRRCLDEIGVGMHWGERKVLERLRTGRFGEVVLFNR